MTLYGKKTIVDTPFDDYSARQEEKLAQLKVARVQKNCMMTYESVVFMASLAVTIGINADVFSKFVIWLAFVAVVFFFWLYTLRYVCQKMSPQFSFLINSVYVTTLGTVAQLCYPLYAKYIDDCFANDTLFAFKIAPIAIAMTVLSIKSTTTGEKLNVNKEVIKPMSYTILLMLPISAICNTLHETKAFFTYFLFAIFSYVFCVIYSKYNKCNFLFSSENELLFSEMPSPSIRFVSTFIFDRLKSSAAVIVALALSFATINISKNFLDIDLSPYALALIYLFTSIICVIFASIARQRYSFLEICYLCMLFSLPIFGVSITIPQFIGYSFIIIIGNASVIGILKALPRRFISSKRPLHVKGVPFIFLVISIIYMVAGVVFMVY